MSHLRIHFGTIVARGSRTRSSNVAFGPKGPSGLDACRTRFECRTRFACGLRPLTTNQPKDNVTPMHTLWDNCCTRFEDTQFECGLRPLRPFGPGTLVARGSKRTRFAASRLSLPNQPKDNVTPMHTLWDNCCTRFEDTQFECGLRPLRPFGPGTLVARSSNVARGS